MQDGVPSHRSKHTVAFLQTSIPDFIQPSNWPPNSHDLNQWTTLFGELCSSWYIVRRLRTLNIWIKSWTVTGTWSVESWSMERLNSGPNDYRQLFLLVVDTLSTISLSFGNWFRRKLCFFHEFLKKTPQLILFSNSSLTNCKKTKNL